MTASALPKHAYLAAPYSDEGTDHRWHGYPDECFAMTSFVDSLVAQVLYGGWGTQPPITVVKMAFAIDFVSDRQAEAEASLAHGWNGCWEFPMGITNTVHSRTETNEQNARIERHLSLIGTAITHEDFFRSVGERLLDVHSCPDTKHCEVCAARPPRGLADVLQILADGMALPNVHLFAKWTPSAELTSLLQADGVELISHDLRELPSADLDANRFYSIWDGTEMQGHEFRNAVWAPTWKRSAKESLKGRDTTGMFDRYLADKRRDTPDSGFSVVEIDEYGSDDGGKTTTVLANRATLEEAKEFRLQSLDDDPNPPGRKNRIIIIDAEGRMVVDGRD